MQPSLRKSSHAVFCIHLHIVLVTKYRRKVITSEILNRLQVIFTDLCEQQKASLLEFNGETDHVHLLVNISPDTHISELVKVLKASSSRLIRKEFKSHVDKYYWKPVFWSSSYFVNSSGGVSLDVLKKYIKQQDSPGS
ncbi:MAG TPA: IS200/IS605 family transposase [Nostoc sp.]|uniref:IS200/IS605 family transposase n=1 Tax=Nostoc sp. TaxID=1180 RepID=UPI002D6E76B2|nr:IS200/IS605 family transposase [Nostoc sp.]HYX17344.1 IS200/IS605 family transposase [Nostoc sp.]